MNIRVIEKEQMVQSKNRKWQLARRADRSAVVLALPQPGGADILRAKRQLRKS